MDSPICTENNHAPFKDQIDDETVMFDLDMSVDDGMPDTPLKNDDNDSDTQKSRTNQSGNSLSALPSRRESRLKSETASRSASFSGLADNVHLEDIYEYDWADSDSESPGGKHEKESYIVQEILADYLKIKSFKRKYPDLTRRAMDAYERSWLQQEGIVPVGRADLGLTALKTDDVMKLLQQDYPEVHVALTDLFRRRKFKTTIENQKRQYEAARIERGEARAEAARRRALDSAADYNHRLITERLNSRRCYWIYKQCKFIFHKETVIPGQFAEYYMNYTPEQLSYLPLSRVLYPHPLQKHKNPPPLPTTLRFGSIKPKVVVSTPTPVVGDVGDQYSTSVDNSRLMDPSNHYHYNNGDNNNNHIMNSTDGVYRSVHHTDGTFSATDNGNTNSNTFSTESDVDKANSSIYRRFKTNAGDMNTENPCCVVCGQLALNYIRCSECKLIGHPKCLDIPDSMIPGVKSYAWTCLECKRCVECNDSGQEDQMMFCDRCDRGYHAFCVGLGRIPNGKWECLLCEALPTPAKKGRPRKYAPKDMDDLPWGYNVRKPCKPKVKTITNFSRPKPVYDMKDTPVRLLAPASHNILPSPAAGGVGGGGNNSGNIEVPKRRRGRPPKKNRIIPTFQTPISPYIPNPSSFTPTASEVSASLSTAPSIPPPGNESHTNTYPATTTTTSTATVSSTIAPENEIPCNDKISNSQRKQKNPLQILLPFKSLNGIKLL
uniref:PHD-type domain-containing protein n=1 Tax=Trichobilharzia regenti TaxID=157069 RepID=A0AA85KK82_TRIRE|nr:unnamed protein product [Trichobilharzia regenti]